MGKFNSKKFKQFLRYFGCEVKYEFLTKEDGTKQVRIFPKYLYTDKHGRNVWSR